jgi:hypothetical protein
MSYVRFCQQSVWEEKAKQQRGSEAGLARTKATLASDDAIARAAQVKLGLATAPIVIARDVEAPYGGAGKPEVVLLSNLDAAAPRWWRADLGPENSITTIVPADKAFVRGRVGFPRGMAAYILFNDLLGGDEPFPREGCAKRFDVWFGLFPAVNVVLQQSISKPPEQDAKLSEAVRKAWNLLGENQTHKAEDIQLTRETLQRVGRDPQVTIVYRDPGLPGDGIGEIDVVRIGGEPHTYAVVTPAEPIVLDGAPLCVVADDRCARYYVWP